MEYPIFNWFTVHYTKHFLLHRIGNHLHNQFVLPVSTSTGSCVPKVWGPLGGAGGLFLPVSSPSEEMDAVVGQDFRVSGFNTFLGIRPHALASSSVFLFCSSTLRTGLSPRPSRTFTVVAGTGLVFFMPFAVSTPFHLQIFRF